jgi:uncharacterized protein
MEPVYSRLQEGNGGDHVVLPRELTAYASIDRALPTMNGKAALLDDKRRLHLQDGPIDLIIEADGSPQEVRAAYCQAMTFFDGLLLMLAGELPFLRSSTHIGGKLPTGPVARIMTQAVIPYCGQFVTPMAAVAGAVAESVLAALVNNRNLSRAYVNNGGDIAYFFGPGSTYTIGICTNPITRAMGASIRLRAEDQIGGVATSGWRGRSYSLGIADAVTVLAETAAKADVAATLIANAVDLQNSPKIQRQSASDLSPDSDLGQQQVTIDVAPLGHAERQTALRAGCKFANTLHRSGLIKTAFLNLQGQSIIVGETTSLTELGSSHEKNPPLNQPKADVLVGTGYLLKSRPEQEGQII